MTRDATAGEEKSSRSYWGFVLWPVAVIVIYVLSAGPIYLAVYRNIMPVKVLAIYAQLEGLLDAASAGRYYRMYLHLWVPQVYDSNGYWVPLP